MASIGLAVDLMEQMVTTSQPAAKPTASCPWLPFCYSTFFHSAAVVVLTCLQMASIEQATDLMEQMVAASQPAAAREHEQLTTFARQLSGDPQLRLQWWDVEYYSERQKEQTFNLSQQELQQYLPLDSVMKGLIDVSGFALSCSCVVWVTSLIRAAADV
jgi:hypothetical protein